MILEGNSGPGFVKGSMEGKRSRVRRVRLVAIMFVLAAIVLVSFATGFSAVGGSGKPSDAIGIQGAVTIALYGPNGQTLGTWKTHNSLVTPGKNWLISCISGTDRLACPGNTLGDTGLTITSYTAVIGIALGTCDVAESSCGIFGTSTNTPLISTPPSPPSLIGWLASATFNPNVLNVPGCATTCTLNDVSAAEFPFNGGTGSGFDDICSPSLCSGGNLPSITISAGDSLAINIQFSVS